MISWVKLINLQEIDNDFGFTNVWKQSCDSRWTLFGGNSLQIFKHEKLVKKQFLEFEGKRNFDEPKWSWQFAILIVKYFTLKQTWRKVESLLRNLTWKGNSRQTNIESLENRGKAALALKQLRQSWTSIKRVEWRGYEKIQTDNLFRIFEIKTEFRQRKMWWAAKKQQQAIRYLSTTRTIYMTIQLIILVVCKLHLFL